MVAGLQELPGLDALLRNLYHVNHFFLVHLDVKVSRLLCGFFVYLFYGSSEWWRLLC